MSAATDWTQEQRDAHFMELALSQAETAVSRGQTPFGAVVLDAAGRLIGEGHNTVRADLDPAAHAEIVALRAAWREVGAWPMLAGGTLYSSCEPCLLCSFVITQVGLRRVIFAARGTDVPTYEGTGAITRVLAEMPGVKDVVGVDPSPVFVEKARELGRGLPQLSFRAGDGRAVPFADASFDLVVFHTTLCHVPNPEKALHEARRVLRAGGWLAVFDGDYVTTTVAIDTFDPLQRAVDAMVASFLHNPWLTRRLSHILGSMGFVVTRLRSHGYTQTTEPDYMLTIVDRGADVLAAAGTIGASQAEALKSEARRRVKTGAFFGHISTSA